MGGTGADAMTPRACQRCLARPGLTTIITARMRAVTPHTGGVPLYTARDKAVCLCWVCNRGLNEAALPRRIKRA